MIEPSQSVKSAAAEVQQAFVHLDWIEATPAHFLHVTLTHESGRSTGPLAPFEIVIRKVNCFHEAVIAEVEGPGLVSLARVLGHEGPYLPHLTLGYVREPGPVADLRKAVRGLRELKLGSQAVEELLLCRVPASRTTLFELWIVLTRVAPANLR